MKTIKIVDDKGNIKEVTEKAWNVLYKGREGYRLYTEPVKEPKTIPTRKPSSPTKKKVTTDDKSK